MEMVNKVIVIDNVGFSKEYVSFRQPKMAFSTWGRRSRRDWIPTPECFVHVWQKSNDLDDFYEKMEKLWNIFVEENSHKYPSELNKMEAGRRSEGNEYGLLISDSRQHNYRNKGVELKKLYRRPKERQYSSMDYGALNQLAQLSLRSCGNN